MKSRPLAFGLLFLPAAALISCSGVAQGAAVSWDDGVGNDLWSSGANWSAPDAIPTLIDDVTFGDTGRMASPNVTNIVDQAFTILSLQYVNTGGAALQHRTQIGPGLTLNVTSFMSAGNQGGTGTSHTVISGATSTLSVGSGTGSSFNVGSVAVSSGAPTQTMDVSGLGTFTANLGSVNIGTGQRNAGNVSLAATNTITATTVSLGGNITTGGALSSLNLGQANTINSNTLNVGGGRSSGIIQYRTGLTGTPTTIIRNAAGTGAAALNLGLGNINASGIGAGTLDTSAGSVDALFSTAEIGRSANGAGGGAGFGTLTFGQGAITATTMNIGIGNNGTNAAAVGNGTVNMNANAGTLIATTVNLGIANNATQSGLGTWNQNGGTAVITTLNMGNRGATGVANVTSTYNLAGGTLKAQTIQAGANGTGTGTATRNFNWTGGTIQNLNSATDLTIASTNGLSLNLNSAGTQKFTADTGRNITVNAAITGAGGFTKDGLGTLMLSGSNNYSGATTITGGTLALTGSGSLASPNIIVGASTTFDVSRVTGGYTLAGGQTLSGNGTVAGAMTVSGTLSPGNSPGTLATGNQVWSDGGDYNWQILDATGAAGTGYDTIDVTGTLDLSSLTAGGFGINLWSLSSIAPDENGDAANFNNALTRSWTLLTTSGGITGFDAADFMISVGANNGTAGFSNTPDAGGVFSLGSTGNNLVLTYAVIPEPNAALLVSGLGAIALLRRRRS